MFFIKIKSQALDCFKKFKTMAEKQSGCSLKALRADREGEFTSKEFAKFCELHGIRRKYNAPYTPQQKRVAERKNRSVIEMARCVPKFKKLPNSFCAEAVSRLDSRSSMGQPPR